MSFDTGQSDADSVSVDETVNGDTYNGTLSATSSAITSIEATNDSSASIDRNEPSGPDVQQIELTGVASDPDGDSLSYEWYEGTDTSGSPEGTGETHDLGAKSCSYSQDWTLLVTDGDANDTQRQTIEALPAPICGGGLSPTPGG